MGARFWYVVTPSDVGNSIEALCPLLSTSKVHVASSLQGQLTSTSATISVALPTQLDLVKISEQLKSGSTHCPFPSTISILLRSESELEQVTKITKFERMNIVTPKARERMKKYVKKII